MSLSNNLLYLLLLYAVLDNDKIMVTGPESVINRITMAKINVSLEGRTESLSESYKITLCDSSGNPVDVQLVTTNVTEVHLDLKIQRVKEVELALHVISGGRHPGKQQHRH